MAARTAAHTAIAHTAIPTATPTATSTGSVAGPAVIAPALNRVNLRSDCIRLATLEPRFEVVLQRLGMPPLWRRPAGFRTLVQIVNEQKISLASARAIGDRVQALCVPFTARRFLSLPVPALRRAGMSGAKIDYCRSIAESIVARRLVLASLARLDDVQAQAALTSVRGIGPWTANVYLSMALGRRDAWPSGDRALAVGVAELFELDAVPDYPTLDRRAEAWRPHRGAAARLVWHAYLAQRAIP